MEHGAHFLILYYPRLTVQVERAEAAGLTPDIFTYNSLLSAYAKGLQVSHAYSDSDKRDERYPCQYLPD